MGAGILVQIYFLGLTNKFLEWKILFSYSLFNISFMKKSCFKLLKVSILLLILGSTSFEASAVAWGYYMKEEICEDDSSQWRCRPDQNVCKASDQTSCPGFYD